MIRLRLLGNLMHGDGHVSNQEVRLLGDDREVRLYEPETQGNVALAEVPSDWLCRYSLKENRSKPVEGCTCQKCSESNRGEEPTTPNP